MEKDAFVGWDFGKVSGDYTGITIAIPSDFTGQKFYMAMGLSKKYKIEITAELDPVEETKDADIESAFCVLAHMIEMNGYPQQFYKDDIIAARDALQKLLKERDESNG